VKAGVPWYDFLKCYYAVLFFSAAMYRVLQIVKGLFHNWRIQGPTIDSCSTHPHIYSQSPLKILLLISLLISPALIHAETSWQLKKDKEGIKVYTGDIPNSSIKAVKVICTLNASLSQLAAVLMDTKAHEQWVYNTKTSYNVKNVSPGDWLYYSEVSMPWPLANRDVVVEAHISQPSATGIMYVTVNTAAHILPENKDKVRVPVSKVNWKVTPVGKDRLIVEYVGQADPGGDIPAWVVNAFSTKGPFETFKKLKELVTSPAYQHAQFDFIKD
jgi:hypothetical protein